MTRCRDVVKNMDRIGSDQIGLQAYAELRLGSWLLFCCSISDLLWGGGGLSLIVTARQRLVVVKRLGRHRRVAMTLSVPLSLSLCCCCCPKVGVPVSVCPRNVHVCVCGLSWHYPVRQCVHLLGCEGAQGVHTGGRSHSTLTCCSCPRRPHCR